MTEDLAELCVPDAAVSRLQLDRKPRAAATRKPRAAATRKLRDLVRRAAASAEIRAVWVYGSYARGAGSVGDIDLVIEVDDPQDPSRAALDGYQAYIRGGNPDSDVLKALSAGGNSIVQATVLRNHDPELGWPLPVEDLALLPAAERQRFALAVPPVLQHAGTGEPLDARETRLLYCRGESVAGADERLASIRAGELPEAVEAALEQRFRVQARRRGSKALSQIIGVEDQLVAAGGRLGTDVELWIRHDGAPCSWLGSDGMWASRCISALMR